MTTHLSKEEIERIVEALVKQLEFMWDVVDKDFEAERFRKTLATIQIERNEWDWTKQCQCAENDRHGETWCCNHCGLPTSVHSKQVDLKEVLSSYNQMIKDEFHDENWDYLDFIAERYIRTLSDLEK